MRVGIYVDGYNLYYGGRYRCGRGTSGWRWLDIRGLAEALVAEQHGPWPGGRGGQGRVLHRPDRRREQPERLR